MRRALLALAVGVALAGACSDLIGIDDRAPYPTGGSGGGASTPTGVGGSGGAHRTSSGASNVGGSDHTTTGVGGSGGTTDTMSAANGAGVGGLDSGVMDSGTTVGDAGQI